MKTPLRTQSAQVFSLALLISGFALAAPSTPPLADWSKLSSLAPGEQIKVVLDSGSVQRGTFQNVDGDSLTVHFATGDQTLSRQSVRLLMTKGAAHRGRNALIGFTVGAITGLALGIASERSIPQAYFGPLANGGKLAGTGAGAMIGVGIGALLPTGRWKTIYEMR